MEEILASVHQVKEIHDQGMFDSIEERTNAYIKSGWKLLKIASGHNEDGSPCRFYILGWCSAEMVRFPKGEEE